MTEYVLFHSLNAIGIITDIIYLKTAG